jgi:PKD repeat protein
MRFAQYVPLVAGITVLVACTDGGPPNTPSNTPPTADFAVACHDLTCQLTDSSTDADGIIDAHVWGFGDGAKSAEPSPVHTYAAPGGQFTVTLTVRDDDGEAATTAKQVTVQLPNAGTGPDRTGT